MVATRVGR